MERAQASTADDSSHQGVRLVALDLDGTLLRNDGSVSARVTDALRAVQEAGITVVCVSARNGRSVAAVADRAGVEGLAVCSNGSVTFDLEAGRILDAVTASASMVRSFVADCRARLGRELCVGWETGLDGFGDPGFYRLNPPMLRDFHGACEIVADVPDHHQVTRVGVGHVDLSAEELIVHVRALAGDVLTATTTGGPLVVLTPGGVTKASALARVCKGLGVGAKQVLALGDQPNDLPMLSWAGRGIAMGNSHPSVLSASKEVTATNEEDGVALVLEDLLA